MFKVLKPTPITDALFVSSAVAEADSPVYVAGTTYAISALVMYNHRRYQSLAGSNTGNTPGLAASAAWWNDLGPTNRWAIFDQKNSTTTDLTTSGGSPTWWVRVAPGPCSSVYVMGMVNVASVRVQMFNGLDLVYDQSATLDDSVIGNFKDYYFEPFDVRTDMAFDALPAYYNATVTVTLTPTSIGATVKCAGIQFGNFIELGELRYDSSIDFKDYSIKEADGFKEWTLIERDFSNMPKYLLYVKRADLRRVYSVITALRATPCVWIATGDYDLTPFNAYGFPRNFSAVLPFHAGIYFSLDIEGI